MKIYTYIKIDIDTLDTLEEEFFEYTGPVALCGGGGKTTTNTQDPIYNARMAAIAERETDMAEEYFNFWKTEYKPFEQEQITANRSMLPTMTEANLASAKYQTAEYQGMLTPGEDGRSLLGLRQDLERKNLELSGDLIGKQAQVASAAYDQALRGVDVGSRVNQAQADVAHSFGQSSETLRRDMSRMGLGTDGEQYASVMAGLSRDRAKTMAGQMTTTRNQAQGESFDRLTKAAGIGLRG